MKKRTLSMEGFASSLYQNLMEKSMKRNGKAFAYLFFGGMVNDEYRMYVFE